MTENEAIKGLETLRYQCKHNGECGTCNICCSAIPLAIQALEEIQQYRAIGTVEKLEAMKKGTLSAMELVDIWCVLEDLKKYSAIGTIEEFKRAKEMEAVYGQVKWERDIAISQLEEIGVALGQKMEEFKALKERSVGKKQGNINDFDSHLKLSKAGFLCCSSTNKDIRYPLISLSDLDYCPRCGQKLDWQ